MKLTSIHHVRFEVRDLERQEAFANDFGLLTAVRAPDRLVMRTRGGDAFSYIAERAEADRFVGFAFEVESEACIAEARDRLGARPVEHPWASGGSAVALRDPDGNEVLLVHAVPRLVADVPYDELVLNTPFRKERFGHQQHARERGPARLWRLGHVGLFVRSFPAATRWYAETLGLIGSDVYHVPGRPEAQIVGFFRLDRGDDYVDHHVIAFMQDERSGCHHISFEAQDFEAQHRTHRFLRARDYEPIWGVGRHPHGSHVFDVWRSPDGARFETFSDTDLLRGRDGTRLHDISTIDLDEWSNDGPERYFA